MKFIDWIEMFIPCSRWIRTYNWREYLQPDLVSGITVGIMLVPQSMSYAKLAGLQPIYGLYTGLVPIFVYSIFGSSHQLAVGPVALVSLLSLMVGILECTMGLLRLGWLIRFISHSVISGFTTSSAIVIALSQAKYFLGYSVERSSEIIPLIKSIISGADKVVSQTTLQNPILGLNRFQRFGLSSSASPHSNENETSQNEGETSYNNIPDDTKQSTEAVNSESGSNEEDLSMEDMVKLVAEKDGLLKTNQEQIKEIKDKLLRTYAEMENMKERTSREAENSKKFAIQNFAKSLLEVADNLERASSVVKRSFAKIDTSEDSVEAVSVVKTLFEGVEITDKQLEEEIKICIELDCFVELL